MKKQKYIFFASILFIFLLNLKAHSTLMDREARMIIERQELKEKLEAEIFNKCNDKISKTHEFIKSFTDGESSDSEKSASIKKEKTPIKKLPNLPPETEDAFFALVRTEVVQQLASSILFANSLYLPPEEYQGITFPNACYAKPELAKTIELSKSWGKKLYPDGTISGNRYEGSETQKNRKKARLELLSEWIKIALSIAQDREYINEELDVSLNKNREAFMGNISAQNNGIFPSLKFIDKKKATTLSEKGAALKQEIKETEGRASFLENYYPVLTTRFGDAAKTFLEMITKSDLSFKEIKKIDIYARIAIQESVESMHEVLKSACKADNKKLKQFKKARESVAAKYMIENITESQCILKAHEETETNEAHIAMAFLLPVAFFAVPAGLPMLLATVAFTGYFGYETYKSASEYQDLKHKFQSGLGSPGFATLEEIKSAKKKLFMNIAGTVLSAAFIPHAYKMYRASKLAKLYESLKRMGYKASETAEEVIPIFTFKGKDWPSISQMRAFAEKAGGENKRWILKIVDETEPVFFPMRGLQFEGGGIAYKAESIPPWFSAKSPVTGETIEGSSNFLNGLAAGDFFEAKLINGEKIFGRVIYFKTSNGTTELAYSSQNAFVVKNPRITTVAKDVKINQIKPNTVRTFGNQEYTIAFYRNRYPNYSRETLERFLNDVWEIKMRHSNHNPYNLYAYGKTPKTVPPEKLAKFSDDFDALWNKYSDNPKIRIEPQIENDGSTSFLHFIRNDPDVITERLYINMNAENAPRVMDKIIDELLLNKNAYPEIQHVKISPASEIGRRPEAIVVYLSGESDEAIMAVQEIMLRYEGIVDDIPYFTEKVGAGIGRGTEPVSSISEVSFGSLRSKLANEAYYAANGSKQRFKNIFYELFEKNRLSLRDPSRNLNFTVKGKYDFGIDDVVFAYTERGRTLARVRNIEMVDQASLSDSDLILLEYLDMPGKPISLQRTNISHDPSLAWEKIVGTEIKNGQQIQLGEDFIQIVGFDTQTGYPILMFR